MLRCYLLVLTDEPTSGLDSTNALKIMNLLKQLTLQQKAVILTLHQPSSRLFAQLDKLLVLSEGRILYYGMQHEISDQSLS